MGSDSRFNSFADFASEYLRPWAGFFIGWTYWLSWVVAYIGDVVVIGGYMQYWYPEPRLWRTRTDVVYEHAFRAPVW